MIVSGCVYVYVCARAACYFGLFLIQLSSHAISRRTLYDAGLRTELIADGAFANLTQLTVLSLNMNPALTSVRNTWFPSARCVLAKLSLESNGLADLSAPLLPACAGTLTELYLGYNALSQIPLGIFGANYSALSRLYVVCLFYYSETYLSA
jgi:hypothetical protein